MHGFRFKLTLVLTLTFFAILTALGSKTEEVSKRTFTYFQNDLLKLEADYYNAWEAANDILVVFVHGGGFRRGVRDSKDDVDYCKALAAKVVRLHKLLHPKS